MSETKGRSPWITVLLVGLPLWLAASAGIALWLYFRAEQSQEQDQQVRFVTPISASSIADDLRKFVEVIGERNTSNAAAKAGLNSVASMIEGQLGPSNTGFRIQHELGPANWSLIYITILGKQPSLPAIWVVTPYDTRAGSRGGEWNSSGLAATLAAAQAFAGDTPSRTVHFLFLPHFYDTEGPVGPTVETLRALVEKAGGASTMLAVEAMGGSEELWIGPGAKLPEIADGIGRSPSPLDLGGMSEQTLAGRLAGAALPATRISTRGLPRPEETDERTPFAGTVAVSAGELLKLIRLLSQ
jgi:hypothetical protein